MCNNIQLGYEKTSKSAEGRSKIMTRVSDNDVTGKLHAMQSDNVIINAFTR